MVFVAPILFFIFPIIIFALPTPEKCNELHVSAKYSDAISNTLLLSIDADLSLFQDKNITHVSISNLNISSINNNSYFTEPFQAFIDGNTFSCIQSNSNKTTEICYFETKNSTFQLFSKINLNGYNFSSTLFYGIIDEISFSSALGPIFSRDGNCGSESTSVNEKKYNVDIEGLNEKKYNVDIEGCCISYKPTYIPNGTPPICTAFQSRSTIYNTDDNYSIFSTAKYDYTLGDGSIIAHGTLTGPSNTNVLLTLNDFWQCGGYPGAPMTCNFPIYDGDNKFLFPLILYRRNITTGEIDFYYESIAGRLIVRNNQTLFEEGFNFTPKNDCSYFSSSFFDATKVFTSQFCCTKFGN
uniref:Uncharacterized protein n=1 Tax=Panagrolaimus sp. PS1159 TaxID=55785 RepID=A0AC35FXQ9_9BILA